ncbi:MAG: efflux RND transporter permease subunit [Erythrobacter sp.]|uniref:efflux RND transporter permease subunit n=1 Tax=Erythrobacter sp. TaxID=1042 RepID=UPI0026352115|nr:efflux RND transporter permease subunit [Erythrobacter sp.]MDJ0978380.1 efflux RND transporter permease subunit [Erythrobacter sp.]
MGLRNISAWSIRNPVIPLVLFVALLLAGLVSFMRMDVTENPDVEFPGVNVTIAQPGAAPTEIENQITQRVEAAVRSINGVNSIQSSASEGSSNTFVEFQVGTDITEALSEVTTAIDGVRGNLPDGILEPQVTKVNAIGEPIGYVAVEADDMTIEELSWFIDDTVSKRLLNVEGMAEVGRFGGVDREIEVILDPAKMQALGVTATQINAVLRQQNVNAAGGLAEVGGTRQSLRVLGNAKSAYDLSQVQLQLGGGRTVKLADVATVRDGYGERTSRSEVGDQEVVNFYMNRARGASDLAVYEDAMAVLEKIESETEGVRFVRLGTSTDRTRGQYTSSMSALIEGAVLAVVVVFFFLRDWRATAISAVAIPLSAIPTFFFMDLMGFNLNFLSLLALGLVAGVLVDDAIVEIENIVRHMRMGKTAYQASIDAADEIGLPVVATSFCIVAVFLPVGLMPGISGEFFKNFAFTVVVAVLMSLAVARMVTPLMAAYFLETKGHAVHGEGPVMDRYLRVLSWTLDTSRMDRRRETLEAPASRARYTVTLLLVSALLLAVTFVTMFELFNGSLSASFLEDAGLQPIWSGLEGLGIAQNAAFAVSPDGTGSLALAVSKTFELVVVVVVSLLSFGAGYLAFRALTPMVAALAYMSVWAAEWLVHLSLGWLLNTAEPRPFSFSQVDRGANWARTRFYDHRVWMLGIGWFSLLVTMLLFAQIPGQFQPTIDSDRSTVQIEMVPGTTLEQTSDVVNQAVAILEEQPEFDFALERHRIGNGTIFLNLKPERERTQQEFEKQVAPLLNQISDARVRFQSQGGGFGTGRDITIMLAGSNPDLLQEAATKLVEQMKGLDTIVAPRISGDVNRPELIITPNTTLAAELGVSTIALSQTIRIATLGEIDQNAAQFSLADRQIPIRVKLGKDDRNSLDTIRNLPVQTVTGGSVPLSRVADITFGAGPTIIQRYNQNRRILIGADLAPNILKGTAQQQIEALPILQNLPTGVIRDAVGDEQWQQELQDSLVIAIIAGILLVFACLVLLYKRLMSPLVNMTSLALAPLGGVFLIWIFGLPNSMPVYIGILLLLGIVSKNSILLIDFAIEEMDRGTEKLEAIMEAGHKRAQPIVMTTVAMTAGMVPTALSLFGDGAWRQPMGIVVIGGLVMSTLLTLLIVPAGFSLADGFEKRAGPWLRQRLLTYKPGDADAPLRPRAEGAMGGVQPAE